MPGINLNLPIPTTSDTQTVVITKIAQSLTAIQNDLTPNVTASEININSPLSFNGNPAINVGYVTMGGNIPAGPIPGSIYYSAGEWFVVTGIGTIQITNNGQLNLSVNGGIGGDYGTSNALVAYDNANSRYRFFGANAVALVDLDARKLVLEGTSATTTFNTTATSNKIINILTLPASGVGLLAYDASTNSLVDGSTVTITAGPTFAGLLTLNAGLTVTGAINGNISFPGNETFGGTNTHSGVNSFSANTALNGDFTHTIQWDADMWFPPIDGQAITGSTPTLPTIVSDVNGNRVIVMGAAANRWASPSFSSMGVRTGDVIRVLNLNLFKNGAGTTTVRLLKAVANSALTVIQTFTTTATGAINFPCTVTSPGAIINGDRWYFDLVNGNINDNIVSCQVKWSR